jgi:hypothetical protein
MSGTNGNFMDGLRTAARENPLAAALIGGGALWLMIGNDRLKSLAGAAGAAAAPVADLAARGQRPVASTVEAGYDSMRDRASRLQGEVSRGFQEMARDARSAASDAASGTTDTLRDRLDDGVATAQEMWEGLGGGPLPGKEVLTQAQSTLADLFERQPLVLGAVGVAIGATVAGALAKSDLEDELVGQFSDGLKTDLATRAHNVSQRAREATGTLKAEFTDAGAEYADRIKQAGRDAVDAASERLK